MTNYVWQGAPVRLRALQNKAPMRLHEKPGFQREGCLRRMIYSRGAYHDEILSGLTTEDFAATTWSNP